MHACPGTYTLVYRSSTEEPIQIGKLGTLSVVSGYYVYVGSAFGPGGLKARLKHHLSRSSRPHWHLDYLSPALKISEIWYTFDQVHREHQWAGIHTQTRGVVQPLPGFGSSDCRCLSHLFFYNSKPLLSTFRRRVRSEFNDHAKIMIENHKNFLTIIK